MVDGLFTSDHLLVVGVTELEEAGEVERRRVEDDGSSTDAEIPFYKDAGRPGVLPSPSSRQQELVSKIDSCFYGPSLFLMGSPITPQLSNCSSSPPLSQQNRRHRHGVA